jgi:hypothetical protein
VQACNSTIYTSEDNGFIWTTTPLNVTASSLVMINGKLVAISNSMQSVAVRTSADLGINWSNAITASSTNSGMGYANATITSNRILVNFGNSLSISDTAFSSFENNFTMGQAQTVYPSRAITFPSGATYPLSTLTLGD